jgi:hypothetical protein
MPRYTQEQIVSLLRQIEVEFASEKTIPQARFEVQITQRTCYRWGKNMAPKAGSIEAPQRAGGGKREA